MVEAIDPQLGEVILDPACGTAGFLVESYSHLEKQCKKVEDFKVLQEKSIFGGEAKPLPYMLSQMNLLLHGLRSPRVAYGNSLAVKLTEIGNKDRVDIILTNPPFGGEEEAGIRGNFPADKQTSETALLFLQLIMRKLRRRPGSGSEKGGRAGVVVPNGTLYASGVAARIRRELIEQFRLIAVVRLPKGVFEPYADIPTNILFFSTESPLNYVWFYEHPLPPDRAALRSPSYSKSSPLIFEEFEPLLEWWNHKKENDHAWKVSVTTLASEDWNLDQKNPCIADRDIIEPGQLGKLIRKQVSKAQELAESLHGNFLSLTKAFTGLKNSDIQRASLGEVCTLQKGRFPTQKTPPGPYRFFVLAADERTANEYQFDGEAVCIPMISSTGHGHASMHRIHYAKGRFAVANILAAVIVNDHAPLLTRYLYYYLWRHKEEKLVSLMAGTANTSLTLDKLSGVIIEYPATDVQEEVVDALDTLLDAFCVLEQSLSSVTSMIEATPENLLHYMFRNP
jgi:type I restriction enzyme M protein